MTPQQRANNFWAVLAAGSNENYRHQANVCHMFQILRQKGVPEEHIIVFMYDDIANNKKNPKKGTMINEVGGPDVYHGVPKDYTGEAVNPDNFIKILTGQKPTRGVRDHGGSGMLCFPHSDLEWTVLQNGLQQMYQSKMYDTLVFFVEACNAGSNFFRAKLPLRVYIATSSPIADSSYADQWSDVYQEYLTDSWSFANMHYMEPADHNDKTLQNLYDGSFAYMQNKSRDYSEPCQYGQSDITASFTIADYFGPSSAVRSQMGVCNSKPTCTKTACPCLKYCLIRKDTSLCNLECCGDNSACYKANGDAYRQRDECVWELAAVLRQSCGRAHEYLPSLTKTFNKICRHEVGRDSVGRLVRVLEAGCKALSLSLSL
eukprot:m51a1_g4015 putative legumain (374) ;mRNA; r:563940-565679